MIQTLTFLAYLSNILLLDPYARFVKIMAKMQEHGGGGNFCPRGAEDKLLNVVHDEVKL